YSCTAYNNAPVVDQGELLEVNRPVIVDSSVDGSAEILRQARPRAASNRPVTAGSNRAVTTAALNASMHRVRTGDTLYSIAFQYDLDFRALALANNLRPPYTIFVGQELSLDINNPGSGSVASSSNIGTPVSNTGVARSSAGTGNSGGVLRQPIGGSATEPSWQWPLNGSILRGFSNDMNKGLDIAANVGDPVRAAGNGEVVYSGSGVQGSGNLIILRHGERYLSAYSHNSEMLVAQGDRVSTGDTIARVGTNSNGTAMLHFEIRRDGQPVDPAALLPTR
ncbi:MAG: peptidoglycan DD-metalloendopeptidase family protein, partial [Gammaproteobacteria bacterium]